MVAQETAANLRGQVGQLFGSSAVSITNLRPDLVDSARAQTVLDIDEKLSKITEASPQVLGNINGSLDELYTAHKTLTLTPDKLDEILAQINTQLEDNSVKFAEQKIEIASETAQQRHASNIEHIREHIEDAESRESANSGHIFLKNLAFMFAPVALWEWALEIDRDINPGKDNSHLSIFTKSEIDYMDHKEDAARHQAAYGPSFYVAPPPQPAGESSDSGNSDQQPQQPIAPVNETGSASSPSDPIHDATEGLTIAQEGISQMELMKLLQKLQEAEENKEKLAEAIAALEAGDPKLAAELLSAATGDQEVDALPEDSAALNPEPPKTPEQMLEAAANRPEDETINPTVVEDFTLPSSVESEIQNEFSNFLDELSKVPQSAIEAEQTATQEQGLIQRNSPV